MKGKGMMKLFGLLAVLGLLAGVLTPSVAFAATSQNVTITGTPTFIAITNSPGDWTINGITGDSRMDIDTLYYSNPGGDTVAPSATVVDGECRFTVTNASSNVALDLTVNIPDFTGGDATANSNTGSNGAATFGAYSWYSGMTYSGKVVAKSTGSSALYSDWSGSTLKWGMEIETQSGAWTTGTAMSSTATITATEAVP